MTLCSGCPFFCAIHFTPASRQHHTPQENCRNGTQSGQDDHSCGEARCTFIFGGQHAGRGACRHGGEENAEIYRESAQDPCVYKRQQYDPDQERNQDQALDSVSHHDFVHQFLWINVREDAEGKSMVPARSSRLPSSQDLPHRQARRGAWQLSS